MSFLIGGREMRREENKEEREEALWAKEPSKVWLNIQGLGRAESHSVLVLSAGWGLEGKASRGGCRLLQLWGSSGASPPSSPALSAVHSVRLSLRSCMIRVLSL